jgi:hypothetical protein
MAKSTHRQMGSSTTLNRRYVRRPTKSTDVAVSIKKRSAEMMNNTTPRVTARELKDQAIKKAMAEAVVAPEKNEKSKKKKKTDNKIHFGFGRVMLALACAAAAVFAIVYFVNLNMPDISLRVAAMQTGINASYPNYIPRDYNVSSITSEDGKITMEFQNSTTDDKFTLIEEASSWDSNALMTNFVKGAYGDNYTVIREQGLTIYVSGSNAAWVNGGVVYKIDTDSGSLTNKQIKSIATSL